MGSFAIENLTFSYPGQDRKALDRLTLTVEEGEFVAICGRSGCGKSTLLRHLKTVLTPHGTREGIILYNGRPLEEADQRTQASEIGYVLQNPDNQIVTDKVWHELAFGLESLGLDSETIRRRVAEMASFFGIQDWFMRPVTELSGGQKQLLNLASVMAMQPGVLILDEPTSQLDPIAASEFLETVKKINRELGTTILVSEHRLDEIFPAADRAAVLEKGRLLCCDRPAEVGRLLREQGNGLFFAMPAPIQIYAGVDNSLPCPLTVRDGRKWLDTLFAGQAPVRSAPPAQAERRREDRVPAVEMADVWFRYEKNAPDVIRGLNLTVRAGEWMAIVGGNGTGKTTALNLMSRLSRPYRGRVKLNGKDLGKYADAELFRRNLGVLPQNPQALFVKKTVELDLMEMFSDRKMTAEEKRAKVRGMAALTEIQELLPMHPYDLSGGEQQRAALAKVLLLEPRILLLDEPTKGIDGYFKRTLAGILKRLQADGVTIVMVSHDLEFCARYADTCAMFFNGSVVTAGPARAFFAGNSFYTT
ncbi:MAG TPA: ATP-binding cassette domain-containing protein, partial [Firmicutes bacterium]|nr:ATP-binding cassette domain-containing protein [Bacillota bacterium]